MKTGVLLLLITASAVCVAAANGSWLKKVPKADRERVSPYSGVPDAASAGRLIFSDNCAKCHGEDAEGKRNRPSLRSERVRNATDGEIAWLLKNGNMFKGRPNWSGLPEQQRWQVIAYIRSLNSPVSGVRP